jgi:hypothetical protein
MSVADRQRALAAERQRRRRSREALGIRVIPVSVSDSFIEWLIESGRLAERSADGREGIANAIRRLITEQMSRVTEGTSASVVESSRKSGKGYIGDVWQESIGSKRRG